MTNLSLSFIYLIFFSKGLTENTIVYAREERRKIPPMRFILAAISPTEHLSNHPQKDPHDMHEKSLFALAPYRIIQDFPLKPVAKDLKKDLKITHFLRFRSFCTQCIFSIKFIVSLRFRRKHIFGRKQTLGGCASYVWTTSMAKYLNTCAKIINSQSSCFIGVMQQTNTPPVADMHGLANISNTLLHRTQEFQDNHRPYLPWLKRKASV